MRRGVRVSTRTSRMDRGDVGAGGQQTGQRHLVLLGGSWGLLGEPCPRQKH